MIMRKIHYGWYVCIGCFLMMFVTIGLCTSVHSIYQPYLIERAHLTQSQGSMITTVRCLFSFLAVFCVRAFYGRLGLKLGTAISVFFLAPAYVGFAVFNSYPAFLVSAGLLGIANGLGGTVPMSILMNRWFSSKKALALGICSAGSGCAGVLMPLILTALIEKKSLQTAFFFEAAFVSLLAVLVFILIFDAPKEKGLAAFWDGSGRKNKTEGCGSRSYVFTDEMVIMYAAAFLMGAISTPAFGHMTVLYAEAGIAKEQIAAGVSMMGLALLVGKCAFGTITDHMGGRFSTVIFGSFCILGYGACCLSAKRNDIAFYSSYLLVGIGVTLATLGMPVWTSEIFPRESFDKIIHKLTLCYVGGEIIFNELPGVIADKAGSYILAYYCFAFISMAVVILVEIVYFLQARRDSCKTERKPSGKPGCPETLRLH